MTTANLYTKLKQAKSEEDVKDIYIKALGLKKYNKGWIDIYTDEIWFEAKDTSNVMCQHFSGHIIGFVRSFNRVFFKFCRVFLFRLGHHIKTLKSF
jgi:hypothetical protein